MGMGRNIWCERERARLRVPLEHQFLVLEPQDAARDVEVEQRPKGAVDAHGLPRLDAKVQQEPAAVRSNRLAAAADSTYPADPINGRRRHNSIRLPNRPILATISPRDRSPQSQCLSRCANGLLSRQLPFR